MINLKEEAERIVRITDKIKRSWEFHHKIIQKQLQMKQKMLELVEKYLKKDI